MGLGYDKALHERVCGSEAVDRSSPDCLGRCLEPHLCVLCRQISPPICPGRPFQGSTTRAGGASKHPTLAFSRELRRPRVGASGGRWPKAWTDGSYGSLDDHFYMDNGGNAHGQLEDSWMAFGRHTHAHTRPRGSSNRPVGAEKRESATIEAIGAGCRCDPGLTHGLGGG